MYQLQKHEEYKYLYKLDYTTGTVYRYFKTVELAEWFARNEGDHLLDYSLVV